MKLGVVGRRVALEFAQVLQAQLWWRRVHVQKAGPSNLSPGWTVHWTLGMAVVSAIESRPRRFAKANATGAPPVVRASSKAASLGGRSNVEALHALNLCRLQLLCNCVLRLRRSKDACAKQAELHVEVLRGVLRHASVYVLWQEYSSTECDGARAREAPSWP